MKELPFNHFAFLPYFENATFISISQMSVGNIRDGYLTSFACP